MFKVNNRNSRHCFGVFCVNFEHTWHVVLVFYCYFEHVIAGWNTLLPYNLNVSIFFRVRPKTPVTFMKNVFVTEGFTLDVV